MRIAIVGGCFTNQHNISFDRLYHQTLKNKIETKVHELEIRTIRYERITKCLEKIIGLQNDYPFDWLLFHLRAEPLLRMSKLYYKYLNEDAKREHAINFPWFGNLKSEEFDLLRHRPIHAPANHMPKENSLYHFLRECNYLAGDLIGNKRYALNVLKKSILQIHEFCFANKINMLLLGPVARPFSNFEHKLSEKINKTIEALAKEKSIPYLSLIKKVSKENAAMFFKNGIHVSQAGHDATAELIYEKLMEEAAINQYYRYSGFEETTNNSLNS